LIVGQKYIILPNWGKILIWTMAAEAPVGAALLGPLENCRLTRSFPD